MHVVGVPVERGFKRGFSTKVSKRPAFMPQVLSEVLQDKMELQADLLVLNHKKSTTQKKLDGEIESSNIFLKAIRKIKQFIQSYLPFAPLIEKFANHVERGADIEAGISKGTDTAGNQAGKPHRHNK